MCKIPINVPASSTEINFTDPLYSFNYLCFWEIINDKLFLNKLSASFNHCIYDLNYLFPDQNKVFADWFCGEIRLAIGRKLFFDSSLYAYIHEKSVFLVFKFGVLVNKYEVDNYPEYYKRQEHYNKQRLNKSKTIFVTKLINVFSYTLLLMALVVIGISISYFIEHHTLFSNIIFSIVVSSSIFVIACLTLFFNSYKEEKSNKIIPFIFYSIIIIDLSGVSIAVNNLIEAGTILSYLLSIIIVCCVISIALFAVYRKKQKINSKN